MHTIPALFPELFWLSFSAILILRITLGGFLLREAYRRHKKREVARMALIDTFGSPGASFLPILLAGEILLGTGFMLGIFTQAVALATVLYGALGVTLYHRALGRERIVYLFVALIALFFLFSPAGPLALDFPL